MSCADDRYADPRFTDENLALAAEAAQPEVETRLALSKGRHVTETTTVLPDISTYQPTT